MNPRKFLSIALKNAINALLVTVPAMVWDSGHFTVTTWTGFLHIALLAGNVVVAREAIVWGPVLLKWTETDNQP